MGPEDDPATRLRRLLDPEDLLGQAERKAWGDVREKAGWCRDPIETAERGLIAEPHPWERLTEKQILRKFKWREYMRNYMRNKRAQWKEAQLNKVKLEDLL